MIEFPAALCPDGWWSKPGWKRPGGRRDPPKGSGRGNWRVEYGSCYVRLSPEDTYVVLRFEAFDEQIRLELPLPEQEGL